jgi:lysophospholipase L1-like esterase
LPADKGQSGLLEIMGTTGTEKRANDGKMRSADSRWKLPTPGAGLGMTKEQRDTPGYISAIATVLLLVLLSILCEGVARLAFYGRKFVATANLNDYEMLDSKDRKLWRLRPGYTQTFEQAIVAKQSSGRDLGVEYLKQTAAKLGIRRQDIIFRINQDGLKGPELDKSHSRLRILTLGDSCTFGSLFDAWSYPRVLERELGQLGWNVEVVNGGVQGYSPKQVLARIEEFKALKPQITTVYIGWNAIFSFDAPPNRGLTFYTPWLVRTAYARLFPHRSALFLYNRPRYADKNDPELKQLDGYVPPFIKDVELIARQMQNSGSTVVLVTLPGLYTTKEEPSARSLQIGHLPEFTNNPYVLARMADEYNSALKRFARQNELQVIDLAEWSDSAFRPRDAYFFDSVHLYAEGEQLVGKYMAQLLAPVVARTSPLFALKASGLAVAGH